MCMWYIVLGNIFLDTEKSEWYEAQEYGEREYFLIDARLPDEIQEIQEKEKSNSTENIHDKEAKNRHIICLNIENNTKGCWSRNREGQEDEKDEVRTDSVLSFLMRLSEKVLIDDVVDECDEEELIKSCMDILSIANPERTERRLIHEPRIPYLKSDEDQIDEIESSENDIVVDLIDLEYDDRPRVRMILSLSEGSMKRDQYEKYSEDCDHPLDYIEDISSEKYRIKEVGKELLKNHIRRNEEWNDDDTEQEKYPNSLEYDTALLPACYYLSSPIHEISTPRPHLIEDGLEDIGYDSEIIERNPCELLKWIPHEDEKQEIDTEKKNEKHKSKKSVREEGKPAREYEREHCEKERMLPRMRCVSLDISID